MEKNHTPKGAENFIAPKPTVLDNKPVLIAEPSIAQLDDINHPVKQKMIQREARRNTRRAGKGKS